MKNASSSRYEVRTIARAMLQLEKAGLLEEYLVKCEQAGQKISISGRLRDLSIYYLKGKPDVQMEVAGPECPLCPYPTK